ncbi:hypothetical protein [Oleiphilus messinensis]|nr:hypothetical protein [Oleiphilus messinensis]
MTLPRDRMVSLVEPRITISFPVVYVVHYYAAQIINPGKVLNTAGSGSKTVYVCFHPCSL